MTVGKSAARQRCARARGAIGSQQRISQLPPSGYGPEQDTAPSSPAALATSGKSLIRYHQPAKLALPPIQIRTPDRPPQAGTIPMQDTAEDLFKQIQDQR